MRQAAVVFISSEQTLSKAPLSLSSSPASLFIIFVGLLLSIYKRVVLQVWLTFGHSTVFVFVGFCDIAEHDIPAKHQISLVAILASKPPLNGVKYYFLIKNN